MVRLFSACALAIASSLYQLRYPSSSPPCSSAPSLRSILVASPRNSPPTPPSPSEIVIKRQPNTSNPPIRTTFRHDENTPFESSACDRQRARIKRVHSVLRETWYRRFRSVSPVPVTRFWSVLIAMLLFVRSTHLYTVNTQISTFFCAKRRPANTSPSSLPPAPVQLPQNASDRLQTRGARTCVCTTDEYVNGSANDPWMVEESTVCRSQVLSTLSHPRQFRRQKA